MARNHTYILTGLVWLLGTTSAFAWDPMEGAVDYSKPAPRTFKTMPAYRAPITMPPLQAPAPAYVPPAPAYVAPAPAPAATAAPIAYTPAAGLAPMPAPVYVPPAPAYAAAPVAAPVQVSSYSDAPTYTTPSRRNRFALGIEGFYDRYEEESVDLTSRSQYGSITGEFTHYYDPNYFSTVEARGSYGNEDYKSISGTIKDVPQYEFEGRVLAGYDKDYGEGRHFKPYIGLGARYYRDDSKGEVTNLGFSGYDRRITQFYLPIGFAFEFPGYGLQFAPKVEFDPMLYGNVSSRLGTISGFDNIENTQRKGYGWRAEFLMGQVNERGAGWQFGPFVRAWYVRDSKTDTDSSGNQWIEPENNRLQAGATLKFLF